MATPALVELRLDFRWDGARVRLSGEIAQAPRHPPALRAERGRLAWRAPDVVPGTAWSADIEAVQLRDDLRRAGRFEANEGEPFRSRPDSGGAHSRVVISVMDEAAGLPWESYVAMSFRGLAPSDGAGHLQAAAARLDVLGAPPPLIVRRRQEGQLSVELRRLAGGDAPRRPPLRFPMRFAATMPWPLLTDGWTAELERMGAVTWGRPDGDADLLHLEIASPDELPQVLHDLAGLSFPPRVLVVHSLGPDAHRHEWCAAALRQGIEAAVACCAADPGSFKAFYRRLLHGEAVDTAVAAALGHAPADVTLAFAHNGEYAVLPQVAALGALLPEPRRAERTDWGAGMAAELSELRASRDADGLLTPDVRYARMESPLEMRARRAERTSRAPRLVTALEEEIEAARRHGLEAAAWKLAGWQANQESHDVAALVVEHARHREVHDAVATAFGAIADLPPDALERASSRVLKATFTGSDGEPLDSDLPLVAGRPCELRVRIGRPDRRSHGEVAFPEDRIAEVLAVLGRIDLDVVALTPDFQVEKSSQRIGLSRLGESDEATFRLVPSEKGRSRWQARIRLCVYHGNILLQSLVLQARVVKDPVRAIRRRGALRAADSADYVATTDFAALGRLRQPALSIVQNRAEGTHWLGFRSVEGGPVARPTIGVTTTFTDQALEREGDGLRAALASIQGKPYLFLRPVNLSDASDDERRRRLAGLVALAKAGWQAHANLIQAAGLTDGAAALNDERVRGLVSVSQCKTGEASVPWAALYDLQLADDGDESVCEHFVKDVDGTRPGAFEAFAANPSACRRRAEGCPLDTDRRTRTVCPFGFWGILHDVELPLQAVEPDAQGVAPPQETRLEWRPGPTVRFAGDPRLADNAAHQAEVAQATSPTAFTHADAKADVVKEVRRGGQALYFYCHAEQRKKRLSLRTGSDASPPEYVGVADFDVRRDKWKDGPRPLVVLSACASVAMTPDVGGDLMMLFRNLGASGVVGTEIEVQSFLARQFGTTVMREFFGGRTLAAAFRKARIERLAELNPLGLAFTHHAPADLHLHRSDPCPNCAAQ